MIKFIIYHYFYDAKVVLSSAGNADDVVLTREGYISRTCLVWDRRAISKDLYPHLSYVWW